MAKNARNYQQRESDRLEMNRLALAGVPQAEIAGRFGISQPQVSYDLKIVRARWQDAASFDLQAARERELGLIDRVEDEAWEGLEIAKLSGDGGTVRFMVVLLRASEQRANVLGLHDNPPKPTAPADDGAKRQRFEAIRKAYEAKIRRDVLREFGLKDTLVDVQTLPPPSVPAVPPVPAEKKTTVYKMS